MKRCQSRSFSSRQRALSASWSIRPLSSIDARRARAAAARASLDGPWTGGGGSCEDDELGTSPGGTAGEPPSAWPRAGEEIERSSPRSRSSSLAPSLDIARSEGEAVERRRRRSGRCSRGATAQPDGGLSCPKRRRNPARHPDLHSLLTLLSSDLSRRPQLATRLACLARSGGAHCRGPCRTARRRLLTAGRRASSSPAQSTPPPHELARRLPSSTLTSSSSSTSH
jgi:hypothetical protein